MKTMKLFSILLTICPLRRTCLACSIGLLPLLGHAQFAGGDGRGDVQFTFTPPSFVGIGSLSGGSNTTLSAWPVPATGILHLDHVVTATVHDMAGQLVGNVARTNVVDISGLPPGAYLLRTERGEVLRFVRE